MTKVDKDGNLEFHPAELPRGYVCAADPNNPFVRVKEPKIEVKRKCACGNDFILHVKFDENNPLHSLCDDCILALPADPNQHYPERFIQLYASDAGEQIGGEE